MVFVMYFLYALYHLRHLYTSMIMLHLYACDEEGIYIGTEYQEFSYEPEIEV